MIGTYSREDLKDVLKEVSHIWNRKITQTDAVICEDMFLIYNFDKELIKYLLTFAKKRGAESLRYLYPVADVLKKQNITDCTEAELTLERSFQKYTDILFYINRCKKIPSEIEKKKIDEIIATYDPTPEEIEEVGMITRNAKNPSLRYFETVLKNKREGKIFFSVKKKEEREYDLSEKTNHIEFDKIKKIVRENKSLTNIAYNTWIRDLVILKETEQQIEITSYKKEDMFYEYLTKQYKEDFQQAFQEVGINKNIVFRKN